MSGVERTPLTDLAGDPVDVRSEGLLLTSYSPPSSHGSRISMPPPRSGLITIPPPNVAPELLGWLTLTRRRRFSPRHQSPGTVERDHLHRTDLWHDYGGRKHPSGSSVAGFIFRPAARRTESVVSAGRASETGIQTLGPKRSNLQSPILTNTGATAACPIPPNARLRKRRSRGRGK